jgi:hypothetical protein
MRTLKVYETYPNGKCTTHVDVINADLLAFIRSRVMSAAGDVVASARSERTAATTGASAELQRYLTGRGGWKLI